MRPLATIATTTLIFGGGTVLVDNTQNPYEDKDTHYELPIKADFEQGERVEIAKDKAQMTLKGWNDEYAITITPQIPTASFGAIDRPFNVVADRKLLSKKMEYRAGDVTSFIEPKAGTENEFDIDFTLHSKPDTNVFTYKIEGAEQFDFFYQPELTPEEIAEGAFRPDNVIGSYAVYHKTRANHKVGDTNYATGKASHIYRPKAIDANGATVWAELLYDNGTLSVTVTQKFLDEAVYPVIVDPTFGITTIGATEVNFPAANNKNTTEVTLSENGDVSKLTFYNTSGGATPGNAKGVIYSSSGTTANVLKGSTNAINTTNPGAGNWVDLTFASTISLTSADYFLGLIADQTVFGRADSTGTSGTGDNCFNTDTYSDGATDPFGTCTTSSFEKSIYATYTAGAPATTATSSQVFINNSATTIQGAQVIIP